MKREKPRAYNVRIYDHGNNRLTIGFVHSCRKTGKCFTWTSISGDRLSKQLGIPVEEPETDRS